VNRFSGLLGSFALVVAGLACGGSDLVLPGSGEPAELRILRGDGHEGPAGSALPLEVEVRDDKGAPLAGQTVAFELETSAPGALIDPESATSGSDGIAGTNWVLGATTGTQSVVARVSRGAAEPLEVRFTAVVGAAGPASIAIVSGGDQRAPAGSRLANPLVVRVTDAFGNPVEGTAVEWSAGSGSVDPVSSVTGPDGLAQTSWSLGASTGSQSVTASSSGLAGSPLTFQATALAGDADRLLRISGNEQSAPVSTELPAPLVVRLIDAAGNAVPDRPVSWIVATGGGQVASPTSMTDGEGIATARWTLGSASGSNTLNAVVSGVGFVFFTATATSAGGGGGGGGGGGPTPTRLEFRVQPSDTEEHETMSPPVEIAVLDQSGSLVTNREFQIKLELIDDENKVRAEGTRSTESGVATFANIRISRDGDYRLRASTSGLPSIFSSEFEIEDD
jgi:adhesin/invasin